VSPTEDIRILARDIIGTEDFVEVYVNAPFAVCEDRDVKGLYKKARAGQIKNFTGLDAPFEAPTDANLEIATDRMTIAESVQAVVALLLPKIEAKN
jgi:adenylylsulfate kinase